MPDTRPSPAIDTDYIVETSLRTGAIERYIVEHDIVALWTQTHDAAHEEHGVKITTSWFDTPVAMPHIDYDMSLNDPTHLTFSGYDRDMDLHTYSIPVAFLDPATRPEAIEAVRAAYQQAKVEAENAATTRAQAARAQDEATYQRLGRTLGHLPK